MQPGAMPEYSCPSPSRSDAQKPGRSHGDRAFFAWGEGILPRLVNTCFSALHKKRVLRIITGLSFIRTETRVRGVVLRMKGLNLPNQLTISRIALVPVIVVLLMFPGKWTCFVAGLLFAVAGFTDLVDGYLARKGNQITSLGKFLDPLADKVLVSSILVMLVQLGWVPGWVAILIICRDVMVTGLRAIASDEGVVIPADQYGKVKTVLQLVALEPLILHYSWFGIPLHTIGLILLYISLVMTVFSGCNYFLRFYKDWLSKNPISAEKENSHE